MMRLHAKFTLVMTSLILLVVGILSYAFGAQLLEQLIQETDNRAHDLALQVFLQAEHSLVEPVQQGLRPNSDAPKEIHDYVRYAFEISEGLQTQLAAAHSNPLIYEVSITDTDGSVLASTDKNLPGTFLSRRASLLQLSRRSFLGQIKALMAPKTPQLFEVDHAFSNDSKPFGEVRVVVDSALLVAEIKSDLYEGEIIVLVTLVFSALLAAMVGRIRFLRTAELIEPLPRTDA